MARGVTDQLNGARKSRVRGFAPWRPIAKSRALLGTVQEILAEYSAYLPLTIRQIFYRLVGVHDYPKTERAYKNLAEMLNRARRACLVDFAAIRDDGIIKRVPFHWRNTGQLVEAYIEMAENFTLDRQAGQPRKVFFVIEAAGMVPLVEDIAAPYGIEVISGGGFDSTTAKYDLAQTLAQLPATEVLHIGDHDTSGVHVFSSITEDVISFATALGDGRTQFTRLAVTPEQIIELALPTAPPKPTDRRAFQGETTQVEAIPPDVLVTILKEAITSRLDQDAYLNVLAEEERIRAQFRQTLIPALRSDEPTGTL
jgi:hypothetical protein